MSSSAQSTSSDGSTELEAREAFFREAAREERAAMSVAVYAAAATAIIATAAFFPSVLGSLSWQTAALVLAPSVALFATATIAYHRLGPDHRLFRFLCSADQLLRFVSVSALIGFGESASSPLWGLATLFGARWTPPLWRQISRSSVFAVVAIAPLVAFFVASANWPGAFFGIAVVLAIASVQQLTHAAAEEAIALEIDRATAQRELANENLQRERTRLARELHDGVCADITALILQLRRNAARSGNERVAKLEGRAQRALDLLRNAVHELRDEDGTIGELSRIMDAHGGGKASEPAEEGDDEDVSG